MALGRASVSLLRFSNGMVFLSDARVPITFRSCMSVVASFAACEVYLFLYLHPLRLPASCYPYSLAQS